MKTEGQAVEFIFRSTNNTISQLVHCQLFITLSDRWTDVHWWWYPFVGMATYSMLYCCSRYLWT